MKCGETCYLKLLVPEKVNSHSVKACVECSMGLNTQYECNERKFYGVEEKETMKLIFVTRSFVFMKYNFNFYERCVHTLIEYQEFSGNTSRTLHNYRKYQHVKLLKTRLKNFPISKSTHTNLNLDPHLISRLNQTHKSISTNYSYNPKHCFLSNNLPCIT